MDKRRKEFIQEYLTKENADDLNNYLENHERIDTLCYIHPFKYDYRITFI